MLGTLSKLTTLIAPKKESAIVKNNNQLPVRISSTDDTSKSDNTCYTKSTISPIRLIPVNPVNNVNPSMTFIGHPQQPQRPIIHHAPQHNPMCRNLPTTVQHKNHNNQNDKSDNMTVLLNAQTAVNSVFQRASHDNRRQDMIDMDFVASILNRVIQSEFQKKLIDSNTLNTNSSRSAVEDFNLRRIYSNNVFSGLKQAHVSDENFKYIVSILPQPFIKGNCLHNVFQMLLRIKNYWIENDMVVEDQDYEMREFSQRRITKHPTKEKAHMYSLLYVDKPSIDINDIISGDASLIENLIRFLYQFISNYAYFVMENEDEKGFKTLSKKVCKTRLKDLKKELPNNMKANNMDNVPVYQHRGTGKGMSSTHAKQRYTDGSEKYLSMYQNKELFTLPFIRKLYQWMLEKYIFCLNINVESDDLYVTIDNNNYPIIKENHNSGGDGQRMNYRTILKNILSLLGLYEPLKTEINSEDDEFDFFHMLGIQTKVDGRKNNGKRKRSSDSQEEGQMTGKRQRRKSTDDDHHDDDDYNDDDESSSDNESYVNDLE